MSTSTAASAKTALAFRVVAECSTTKARAAEMVLPHATVETPVFMPVGTQGTLKGKRKNSRDDRTSLMRSLFFLPRSVTRAA